MEVQLNTNGASPEYWETVLKLFEANAAQPEEANKVMKEQDGEVEAVPAGKESDLSCDLNLLIVARFMSFLFSAFLCRCCRREPRSS